MAGSGWRQIKTKMNKTTYTRTKIHIYQEVVVRLTYRSVVNKYEHHEVHSVLHEEEEEEEEGGRSVRHQEQRETKRNNTNNLYSQDQP